MRRVSALYIIMTFVCCCFLAIAGCGGEGDTSKDSKGDLSTLPNGAEDWKTGDITAEQLGVPIFPGAEMDKEQSGALSGKDASQEGEWLRGIFWSEASPAGVKAWYKEQLSGEEGFSDVSMTSEKGETGMFTFKRGEIVYSVIVKTSDNTEKGNTQIEITSMKGSVDIEKGKNI